MSLARPEGMQAGKVMAEDCGRCAFGAKHPQMGIYSDHEDASSLLLRRHRAGWLAGLAGSCRLRVGTAALACFHICVHLHHHHLQVRQALLSLCGKLVTCGPGGRRKRDRRHRRQSRACRRQIRLHTGTALHLETARCARTGIARNTGAQEVAAYHAARRASERHALVNLSSESTNVNENHHSDDGAQHEPPPILLPPSVKLRLLEFVFEGQDFLLLLLALHVIERRYGSLVLFPVLCMILRFSFRCIPKAIVIHSFVLWLCEEICLYLIPFFSALGPPVFDLGRKVSKVFAFFDVFRLLAFIDFILRLGQVVVDLLQDAHSDCFFTIFLFLSA
mmetsp:Transcript_30081/g.75921  ORF Transcript_30081/g.75921 Transcript_30081/m.75921 type:complete len:334 (-) Transcript_30081:1449-2450(-)